MFKSPFDKWLVTLAMLVIIGGAVWHFVRSNREAQGQQQSRTNPKSVPLVSGDFHPDHPPSMRRTAKMQFQRNAGLEKLPREKVEAWLAEQHRNATGLLAAFHALGDTNYLNEAATNFPNNPQVELAVLARDEFPADRRKWLDLFKVSSPSNSLANYLSAENFFESGNTDAAVQDLLAATDKSQFENYAVESELDEEELAQFAGKSAVEAYQIALAGVARDDLPELATLKRLAQGINDLQTQEIAAGDPASVQNLAQMGMVLGNQLANGGGGKLVIDQLVGMAAETLALSQLNPNASCGFLGGQTPGQVLQQLKEQKASLRDLDASFQTAFPQLTGAEKANYIQRLQIYGELDAMRWVVQQHPPSTP